MTEREQMLGIMLEEAQRVRQRSGPLPGDGVVWVWDRAYALPPNLAVILRDHPWPFGWSVIRDAAEKDSR